MGRAAARRRPAAGADARRRRRLRARAPPPRAGRPVGVVDRSRRAAPIAARAGLRSGSWASPGCCRPRRRSPWRPGRYRSGPRGRWRWWPSRSSRSWAGSRCARRCMRRAGARAGRVPRRGRGRRAARHLVRAGRRAVAAQPLRGGPARPGRARAARRRRPRGAPAAAASPSASSWSPPRRSCSSTCRSPASSGSRRPHFGWFCVLLVAGGVVGPLGWVIWSLVLTCLVAALLMALRSRSSVTPPRDPADHRARPRQLRGPGLAGRHRVRAAAMRRGARDRARRGRACWCWPTRRPTLAWQEPLSALRAGRTQHHLAAQLHALELAAPHAAPPIGAQLAIAARALARSRRDGQARRRAAHRAHRPARRRRARDHARRPARGPGPHRRHAAARPARHDGHRGAPHHLRRARSGTSTRCAAATRSPSACPTARFRYAVEDRRIVQPADLSVLRRVGHDRLVLSACHPLFSAARRIVVFARLTGVGQSASQRGSPCVSRVAGQPIQPPTPRIAC